MNNNDLSRTMGKNDIYFKIRSQAAKLSEKLGKRVTVKEFLEVASKKLLAEKDIEKSFK
jgi:hypothetical protein